MAYFDMFTSFSMEILGLFVYRINEMVNILDWHRSQK